MATIPLATLACTVDETGISAPSYADILATLQYQYRSIYGSDVNLDADTQDGQWLAIQAAAFNDNNNAAILVYNQFSPTTAQGAGLSSIVKTNGLQRNVPSNSTADLTLIGQAGTVILNGQVSDGINVWSLPASVTIPGEGTVIQTATCAVPGAISATAGAISRIVNPQLGWQSASNAAAATPGAPVELDGPLRQRQARSTAQPAQTPLQAITANVANVPGVTSVMPYENDTSSTDSNGLPPHSISLVVTGGDDVAIATAISNKKTIGTDTYGTTSEVVFDPAGVAKTISFFRPTVKRVVAAITVNALPGYVSTTGDALKAALAAYVSGLSIGTDVYYTKCIGAADLPGNPLGASFNITAVTIAFFGGALGTSDLTIAFNERASLVVADIALTVS